MRHVLLRYRAATLALLLAAIACGGPARPRQPAGTQAAGASPGHDPGAAGDQAGSQASGQPGNQPDHQASSAPVTEAECRALLTHVIALANAAQGPAVPAEQAPTDEQLAAIHAQLAPEFIPPCLALDRATFACEMNARTRDDLLACSPQ